MKRSSAECNGATPHAPTFAPTAAGWLLRWFTSSRHRESLEGDLLEEIAAGRSQAWYWRQVGWAVYEHACSVVRQQLITFLAATMFFLVALWVIAPATYHVMDWARAQESLRILVLLAWLGGVPLLLGGVAGAAERRRRIGAILLGAALAWLTPVTLPFNFAVCDLCARPLDTAAPGSILLLTTAASALLAGLGAWCVGRIHPLVQEKFS